MTVDNEPRMKADLTMDILDLTPDELPLEYRKPDVVWASPPCKKFTVLTAYHNWRKEKCGYVPTSTGAIESLELVNWTFALIDTLSPRYWFMENPRAMLRKMTIMKGRCRRTVTYCQYGESYQKPTDIWTNCLHWRPKRPCGPGSPCHEAVPRGSSKGVQGLSNSKRKGRIPTLLAEEIVRACEKEPSEPWF